MKQKYKVLRIELSNKCNLHCTYCRTLEGNKYNNKGEISLDKIKNIIDEAQKLGFMTLVLTGGGEPFMRKDIFENSRISFGSEMENTSFYLYNSNKTYEFRQFEINSGAIYEHKISDAFIGTFRTGLKIFPNSRIFEKNESFNDYFFDAKPKPALYFNLGISYNPFVKSVKKHR